MIDLFIQCAVRFLIWLRYRVTVRGLSAVLARGRRAILILPNHPALIDPIILLSRLHVPLRPRALADARQIDRFFIRSLAKRANVLAIPSTDAWGPEARESVRRALDEIVACLRRGENCLLYPSGRNQRSRYEDLGGNSAVEYILKQLPDVRIVLARTRGLWGSSFGWASGVRPDVAASVKRGVLAVLGNLLFFTPRRRVSIEFAEPDDLPRSGSRSEINRYLENFYNQGAEPNTRVPLWTWGSHRPRVLPEPQAARPGGRVQDVPPQLAVMVRRHIAELSGVESPGDDDLLAADLGLDSLSRLDLLTWLHKEFGFAQGNADSLQTVGDVILSAAGMGVPITDATAVALPRGWFAPARRAPGVPDEATLDRAIVAQARRNPGRVLVADSGGRTLTYRGLLRAAWAVGGKVSELGPTRHVGIMLPASPAADVAYLACLLAGKTPLVINWTVGARNVAHALETLDVAAVLTSKALAARLQADGVDLAPVRARAVYLEDVRSRLTLRDKLRAAWRAGRGRLPAMTRPDDVAAVLMTSGSESTPKLVPLSHANILANMRGVLAAIRLGPGDSLVSMLPPFHSFGLTVGLALPLCAGVRVVHHPSPTEGLALAGIIEAARPTLLVGAPAFLDAIVRAARPGQLESLRLIVSGADACPRRLYQELSRACPKAVVIEGYGVTECSPIISVNDPREPVAGTIGRVLPNLKWAIVDESGAGAAAPGEMGMLLVRGPSVFGGYVGQQGRGPFVDFGGERWYSTGDLVSAGAGGVLTFRGRLKRFIKLGGEMISLPAIEGAIAERLAADVPVQAGPQVAVEAHGEPPQVVLVTTLDISRQDANEAIQAAGLSGLHNVREVRRVEAMPVLGTGKVDYRAVRAMLE
jgi:long-chain-fatty-acid--[acyl-carrier-protein] ligase